MTCRRKGVYKDTIEPFQMVSIKQPPVHVENLRIHSPNPEKAQNKTKKGVVDFGRLRILVGKIVEVKRHPDADSLFVETGSFFLIIFLFI